MEGKTQPSCTSTSTCALVACIPLTLNKEMLKISFEIMFVPRGLFSMELKGSALQHPLDLLIEANLMLSEA